MNDPYEVLGVPRTATDEEIKKSIPEPGPEIPS